MLYGVLFELFCGAASAGLRLWKRNLQLLVPFLIEPLVQLRTISKLGKNEEGREVLKVGA